MRFRGEQKLGVSLQAPARATGWDGMVKYQQMKSSNVQDQSWQMTRVKAKVGPAERLGRTSFCLETSRSQALKDKTRAGRASNKQANTFVTKDTNRNWKVDSNLSNLQTRAD